MEWPTTYLKLGFKLHDAISLKSDTNYTTKQHHHYRPAAGNSTINKLCTQNQRIKMAKHKKETQDVAHHFPLISRLHFWVSV